MLSGSSRVFTSAPQINNSRVSRWLDLNQALRENSVQGSTQTQYHDKWSFWIRFLDQFFLHSTHPGSYLRDLSIDRQLDVLNSFLAYLYFDKGISPKSVSNFLSAIRYYFQVNNVPCSFLDPAHVQRFLQGARLQEAQLGVRHDKKRPMPLSMIYYMINTLLHPLSLENRAYRIAVLLAYFFLLRQSEYIYRAADNDHALRVDDIEYRIKDTGSLIPSHRLRSSGVALESFDLVKVTLRHCKNDPFRQGNSFWCQKYIPGPRQIDLVSEMLQFSLLSNTVDGDVFTSVRKNSQSTPVLVRYRKVMRLIHDTATQFLFPKKLFGTHSFRISGATTLEAGQVSAQTIQKLGGWKSMLSTQMEYSQASSEAFSTAH